MNPQTEKTASEGPFIGGGFIMPSYERGDCCSGHPNCIHKPTEKTAMENAFKKGAELLVENMELRQKVEQLEKELRVTNQDWRDESVFYETKIAELQSKLSSAEKQVKSLESALVATHNSPDLAYRLFDLEKEIERLRTMNYALSQGKVLEQAKVIEDLKSKLELAVGAVKDLLVIANALEDFKFKCYEKTKGDKAFADWVMANAPCSYGWLSDFHKTLAQIAGEKGEV